MNQTFNGRSGARLLLVLAGVAGAAGAARGQCDLVFRGQVPDLDQKRFSGMSGVSSLPNGGRMYCVPTSCIDQQAYLANHGYPNAVNSLMAGPRDWQTANYNNMTQAILTMGNLMQTDPFDGTSGAYLEGWMDYMTDRLPNDYFVSYGYSFSPDDDITHSYPETLASMLMMGCLVNLSIGWFEHRSGPGYNYWERTGGHCTALAGTSDACGSQPILIWRDPGSGDSEYTQSQFTNSLSSLTFVTANFSWKDDSSVHARSTWRINAYNGGSSWGYVGGYRAIWPNFGIGIDTAVGKLKFHFPKTPSSDGGSKTTLIDFSHLGVSGAPLSIDLSPDNTWTAVLASSPGFLTPKKLLKINQADGSVRQLAPLSAFASRVLFSPRGELFAVDFNQLKKINPDDGAIIAVDELYHTATSLVYDDAADRLAVLSAADRVITLYGPDLKLRSTITLPTGVIVGDNSSITIHPTTGRMWIANGDTSTVYEIIIGAAVVGAPRTLTGAVAPRHLQFSPKGEIMVLDGGLVREYTEDSPTVPRYHQTNKTGMAGLAFGGPVKMAKSRTSYNPATIHLYDDISVEPPLVPDCRVDLNDDAIVDFADFLEFLNLFDEQSPRADFNNDGIIDFGDYLEFLNQYNEGCGG